MDQTPEEAAFMQAGLVAHNSGDLKAAEENYRNALAINPGNPDGLHLLGYIAYQTGFNAEAISLIDDAIKAAPSNPLFYNNLASIHRADGDDDSAIGCYQASLELKGDDPDVLNDLGNLLRKRAATESSTVYLHDAETLIRRAIDINPEEGRYHNNLGVVLQNIGPSERLNARSCFLRALELNSDMIPALGSLGSLAEDEQDYDSAEAYYLKAFEQDPVGPDARHHYMDGLKQYAELLETRGRISEAIVVLKRAQEHDPTDYLVRMKKGTAYMLIRRDEEALDEFQELMEMDPSRYDSFWYFSRTLRKMGHLDQARDFIVKAMKIFPDELNMQHELGAIYIGQSKMHEAQDVYEGIIERLGGDGLIAGGAGIYSALGIVYLHTGTPEQVLEMYAAALKLDPENGEVNNNYALCLLALGLLTEGWERLRSRWRFHDFPSPARPFQKPFWDGQPLEGKTIAVWGEQGIGDEICFASMIPELKNTGAKVVIECEPRLETLFARSFDWAQVHPRAADLSVPFEDVCDYQIPVLDLAQTYRPTIDSFPAGSGPYLKPAPARSAFWHGRLDELGSRPKVGVLWRSMVNTQERMPHYVSVEEMAPVLAVQGVDFVNLMYVECSEDRARITELYGVDVHTWDDIDLKDDQDDLAALISNLDLVVCPMTAPGILAGALNIPVFCFVTTIISDDFLGHPDAPGWLPSMRHFIKDFQDPWAPVMEKIAAEMKRVLGLA